MKLQTLKKMSVAIATLFVMMLVMPTMAKAQTEYPLNIAGVRVTSNNCNDLSVIDGVSGTVKYDPNSNTLTLEDATIDVGDGKNCIWGGKEGTSLAIVVKGTCKLSSTTWSAVNLWIQLFREMESFMQNQWRVIRSTWMKGPLLPSIVVAWMLRG
ncbi:hypothetical protein [Porphyromonas crevioricanis]|uniref:hypothetical protein n=1 Tax=Porphyromonas crevioricanis TaxID=393921 RepID=UPI00068D7F6E|nr:hypothetical protein [Porphyromonas crevioricanis]